MSILLTDKHVERCVTLLALIRCASNAVELERDRRRLRALQINHPDLLMIRDDDPRITARLLELETLGQDQIVEAFCSGCKTLTGKRLESHKEPIYCHACSVSRMFREAAKR